tara:strand:- start:173 stop:553 length:381 start_codon:yes stop_codon:yes gene_type:complete
VINTGLFTNRSWDIPEEIKYNKETNTNMKIPFLKFCTSTSCEIEKYQACYLVQDIDEYIYEDIFNVLYGNCSNRENEILMSLHLLGVWMENDFKNEAEYLDEYTCDFLKELYYKINKEIGYIIFRL